MSKYEFELYWKDGKRPIGAVNSSHMSILIRKTGSSEVPGAKSRVPFSKHGTMMYFD